MGAITLKPLTMVNELKEVQKLERMIWNEEPIPTHQTLTVVKNGGIVLGAYDENQMVGFLYSFPGFRDQQCYLCSHTMGIHPGYQKQKIGEQLKRRQYQLALKAGYTSIVWTFDPLLSVNAYLNLHKLRAVATCFIENYYGNMEDALNQGLPSDRFLVNWQVTTGALTNSFEQPDKVTNNNQNIIFETKTNDDGFPVIVADPKVSLSDRDDWLVPIPVDFQQMKLADDQLARDWRMKTRDVFLRLFNEGFVASDLMRTPDSVSFYVFNRQKDFKASF